jgi:hypothetical protein
MHTLILIYFATGATLGLIALSACRNDRFSWDESLFGFLFITATGPMILSVVSGIVVCQAVFGMCRRQRPWYPDVLYELRHGGTDE